MGLDIQCVVITNLPQGERVSPHCSYTHRRSRHVLMTLTSMPEPTPAFRHELQTSSLKLTLKSNEII